MKKVLIAGLAIVLSGVSMASAEDEMTSLSYISYLERYATVQPVSQEESLEAVINMPLVGGDRVDTAREARMEIILADANLVWLDEYTTLSLDAVALSRDAEAERTVIFLADGTIIFEITEFSLSQKPIRIDGRGATVYLDDTAQEGNAFQLPRGSGEHGLRVEAVGYETWTETFDGTGESREVQVALRPMPAAPVGEAQAPSTGTGRGSEKVVPRGRRPQRPPPQLADDVLDHDNPYGAD